MEKSKFDIINIGHAKWFKKNILWSGPLFLFLYAGAIALESKVPDSPWLPFYMVLVIGVLAVFLMIKGWRKGREFWNSIKDEEEPIDLTDIKKRRKDTYGSSVVEI